MELHNNVINWRFIVVSSCSQFWIWMVPNKSQIFLFAVDTVISLRSYIHSQRMRCALSFQHVVKGLISCPPSGLLARCIHILLINMNCISYNSFHHGVHWVTHAARTYVCVIISELWVGTGGFLKLFASFWLHYLSAIRTHGILFYLACKWRSNLGSAVYVITEYMT